MNLMLRKGEKEDAIACGEICYKAFKAIADRHNFPPDFPNPESAIGLMNYIFSSGGVYSLVAESEGQIVGSNFLWEDILIAGVGPITVDPGIQNKTIGRNSNKPFMRVILGSVQIRGNVECDARDAPTLWVCRLQCCRH